MINKIKKIDINSFFVKLYVVISFIYLIVKIIMALIEDEVLSDVFLINFASIIFCFIDDVRNFFGSMFYGVGIISISLIIHFGIFFYHKLEELEELIIKKFNNKCLENLCIIFFPIFTILVYILSKISNTIFPLCIIEGFSISGILFVISKLYKKFHKVS